MLKPPSNLRDELNQLVEDGIDEEDEPDWLLAAGEEVGMSGSSSRASMREDSFPPLPSAPATPTTPAIGPEQLTINRLPPSSKCAISAVQQQPLDAALFSEGSDAAGAASATSDEQGPTAVDCSGSSSLRSTPRALREVPLGEGTPSVLVTSAPTSELPRSTSAADAEFADWANWESAGACGSLDGGGLDAYASAPLPESASRILSPLARREAEKRAAESIAQATYASWDTWDEFDPRAGESPSPTLYACAGDEEMVDGTASKSRRHRSATGGRSAAGGGSGSSSSSSARGGRRGGGGLRSCLWSILRPPRCAAVCPAGVSGGGGTSCALPRRRSVLWPVVCVCVLALTLSALTWAQPRTGRDSSIGSASRGDPTGGGTAVGGPTWLAWAERVRTASGELLSAHLRWTQGSGGGGGGSDEWQVVRRGGGVPPIRTSSGRTAPAITASAPIPAVRAPPPHPAAAATAATAPPQAERPSEGDDVANAVPRGQPPRGQPPPQRRRRSRVTAPEVPRERSLPPPSPVRPGKAGTSVDDDDDSAADEVVVSTPTKRDATAWDKQPQRQRPQKQQEEEVEQKADSPPPHPPPLPPSLPSLSPPAPPSPSASPPPSPSPSPPLPTPSPAPSPPPSPPPPPPPPPPPLPAAMSSRARPAASLLGAASADENLFGDSVADGTVDGSRRGAEDPLSPSPSPPQSPPPATDAAAAAAVTATAAVAPAEQEHRQSSRSTAASARQPLMQPLQRQAEDGSAAAGGWSRSAPGVVEGAETAKVLGKEAKVVAEEEEEDLDALRRRLKRLEAEHLKAKIAALERATAAAASNIAAPATAASAATVAPHAEGARHTLLGTTSAVPGVTEGSVEGGEAVDGAAAEVAVLSTAAAAEGAASTASTISTAPAASAASAAAAVPPIRRTHRLLRPRHTFLGGASAEALGPRPEQPAAAMSATPLAAPPPRAVTSAAPEPAVDAAAKELAAPAPAPAQQLLQQRAASMASAKAGQLQGGEILAIG